MPMLDTIGPLRRSPARLPASSGGALRKFGALPRPALEWNAEVERDTAHLYERIKNVVPSVEWPFFAPYVRAINAVKKERNAVILAHNYRRRRSTIASPISSATRFSSPAKPPRSKPT